MKKISIIIAVVVVLIIVFYGFAQYTTFRDGLYTDQVIKTSMQITSSQFEYNTSMPEKYSCEGESVSPHLEFSDIPEEAKSLALIVHDPDAIKPAGRIWDHWIIWNIDPDTKEFREGVKPDGVFGLNTSGHLNFVPACPPDAEHRYIFTLYALDTNLDLEEGADRAQLEQAMEGHIIEKAELIGLYNKKANR